MSNILPKSSPAKNKATTTTTTTTTVLTELVTLSGDVVRVVGVDFLDDLAHLFFRQDAVLADEAWLAVDGVHDLGHLA